MVYSLSAQVSSATPCAGHLCSCVHWAVGAIRYQFKRNDSMASPTYLLPHLKRPFAVVGIINTTPDSFFDGGCYQGVEAAFEQACRLVDEGADVIDIGGESTRPGAATISAQQEMERVVELVQRLAARISVPISVDTTKAAVAQRALEAGAAWINDISAGRFDPAMAGVVARAACPVILMHSRHTPQTMQLQPSYENVVEQVCDELQQRIDVFVRAGVEPDKIIVDPGIGFAKRYEDNIALLAKLDAVAALGYPVLVGTSRKSFIGQLCNREVQQRLGGSLGSVAAAYLRGARLFRVHDVAATVDALTVFSAILDS